MKELRDLNDLTMHDVKLMSDEETTGRRHSLRDTTDHHPGSGDDPDGGICAAVLVVC